MPNENYNGMKGIEGLLTEGQYDALPRENKELLAQLGRLPERTSCNPAYSAIRRALYFGAANMDPALAKELTPSLKAGADEFERYVEAQSALSQQLLDTTAGAVARLLKRR
ncbi:hypothetical protein JW711_00010 [Candidatus Woesearchaeota archaeon]|nr:hypothetical protein [Candidatus Woesearchaeota archaeon]